MGDTALIRGLGAAIKQLNAQVQIIGVQADGADIVTVAALEVAIHDEKAVETSDGRDGACDRTR